MAAIPGSNTLANKRIPTIVGLVLLVVAMVLGVLFIGDGVGVFAPRATPETTPKQIRVTNVTDRSFTISFMTDAATTAFVRYGTDPEKLSSQQTDDRNRLSNSTEQFTLHHITVRNLDANTAYYYIIGTGSGARFDNEGTPFRVITARREGTPSAARTIYGNVQTESGVPAAGAVVYLAAEGAGDLSSLVQTSGSWAIPLSDARTTDGSGYAKIELDAALRLLVQGPSPTQTATVTTTVEKAQPVPTIQYGQTGELASAEDTTPDVPTTRQPSTQQSASESEDTTASSSAFPTDTTSATDATQSAQGSGGENSSVEEKLVFDLDMEDESEPPTLTTEQPVIRGTIEPGVEVRITVNSETQITHTLITNDDGSFELDLSELKKQLEPGEHTITLEFVNPATGEPETITRTFFVEPQSATTQIAQASTTPTPTAAPRSTPTPSPSPTQTPFGTNAPFPIDGSSTQSSSLNGTGADGLGSGTSSTSSAGASGSARTSMPSTASGVPVSGSVGTTLALIFGGMFFIISGVWSFWISRQFAHSSNQ